jgi:ATP-binding cassette subfamily B protein
VLLLDQATSRLDTVSEGRIREKLGRMRTTRIVVVHRLSTVAEADRLLVMEKGRLVGAQVGPAREAACAAAG